MHPDVPERLARRAGLAVVGAFLLASLCFTGQFPPFANPNEASRFATVFAAVESGTFRIDDAVRWVGQTEDKSASGGHFYSNKAPGLAFAAIPVYRVLRVFLPRPETPFAPIWVWLRILVVTSVCCVAFEKLRRRIAARHLSAASPVVAALAFGTPLLFYGRSFFSHAWTASLLFLSFEAIRDAETASARRRVGVLLWAAGLLAGWAAISEYPVALLAGLLLVRAAARGALRNGALFAAGLLLPVALLLAYNAICFGSPFVLSSAREALPEFSDLAGKGLFGFRVPDPRVGAKLLFHPARGLFLFSPFLLWAIPGFVRWRRSGEHRADWLFCLTGSAVFFAAMCAYPNWHGGWSLGCRYLMPILFPLALAASRALDSPRSRWLFGAAAAFSIGVHSLEALAWPYYPLTLPWPPRTGSLWFLSKGWMAPAQPGIPPAIAVGVAVLAGAVALAACASREERSRRRSAVAVAAGLALFAATLALAPAPPEEGRRFREGILVRAVRGGAVRDLRLDH
ncbi:MAG: hypothetical protein LC796_05895 [Acidobacteria bacterium]|nr:hypothetical protein [Acidobacteriota bacterium]MCA1611211.1 hypothetical protein [Acidobacteriota bacterium]